MDPEVAAALRLLRRINKAVFTIGVSEKHGRVDLARRALAQGIKIEAEFTEYPLEVRKGASKAYRGEHGK